MYSNQNLITHSEIISTFDPTQIITLDNDNFVNVNAINEVYGMDINHDLKCNDVAQITIIWSDGENKK